MASIVSPCSLLQARKPESIAFLVSRAWFIHRRELGQRSAVIIVVCGINWSLKGIAQDMMKKGSRNRLFNVETPGGARRIDQRTP
jgi:hypothetical protein